MRRELLTIMRSRSSVLSKFDSGAIAGVVKLVLGDPKIQASTIRPELKPYIPSGLELTPQMWSTFFSGVKTMALELQKVLHQFLSTQLKLEQHSNTIRLE